MVPDPLNARDLCLLIKTWTSFFRIYFQLFYSPRAAQQVITHHTYPGEGLCSWLRSKGLVVPWRTNGPRLRKYWLELMQVYLRGVRC